MARGINKVILIGNLGRDPEIRYSQGGTPVANFSIATSESWKDKQTGEAKDRTEWHNLVAFNRLAEIVGEYLKKGSKVYVEGKLQTDKYEKDGQTHYSTKVIARDLQMLDSRGQANGGQASAAGYAGTQESKAQADAFAGDDFNDDIPF